MDSDCVFTLDVSKAKLRCGRATSSCSTRCQAGRLRPGEEALVIPGGQREPEQRRDQTEGDDVAKVVKRKSRAQARVRIGGGDDQGGDDRAGCERSRSPGSD